MSKKFCLHVCLCITHVNHGVCGGQKRLLNPLELELCAIVNSHVGTGHQAWFLLKSSQHS